MEKMSVFLQGVNIISWMCHRHSQLKINLYLLNVNIWDDSCSVAPKGWQNKTFPFNTFQLNGIILIFWKSSKNHRLGFLILEKATRKKPRDVILILQQLKWWYHVIFLIELHTEPVLVHPDLIFLMKMMM